ncbi:DMT family transporter [Candidatus Blochmannia ocreatus (nom. nud.)]|uniref:Multidrug efflux SMR transporter n=1 Tax=Candidatus Blochmannia ocreatus (nom. nud.) TaxID=251538 RepID=A0ABY4SU81_9ENTR|nr:multidrug efflux SMR transporter [Candidatus Blochmannia ocreatus]URJ25028.1 multidrug efflux SMR transporter [Candidatus Blochmannia ocreatus]
MDYLYLFIAVLSEVVATAALKESDGFSRFWPIILVVIGYSVSFILLSLVLRTIPIGIVYSCWAGMGIVCITTIGYFLYNQKLDSIVILGIVFIIIGIVLINLFSVVKNY